MNFKEAFLDDLDTVFFQDDEFASTHTLDEISCPMVITRSDIEAGGGSKGTGNRVKNAKEHDIAEYQKKIYIKESDLKKKITPHSVHKLDGQSYFVDDIDHSEGVYILYLTRAGM